MTHCSVGGGLSRHVLAGEIARNFSFNLRFGGSLENRPAVQGNQMIICVSNRRFGDVIRQLEGLGNDVTAAEIEENGDRYGKRLGEYVRSYGVNIVGARLRGEIIDLNAALTSNDRETVIRGVQMLQPLNVSVEQGDLPRLILNRIMLACFQENWFEVQPLLSKIQPSGLLNLLEDIAGKIAFGQRSPEKAVETDLGFESWCLANGLPVPGAARNAYDRYREAEVAEAQEYRQEQHDKWLNGDDSWPF